MSWHWVQFTLFQSNIPILNKIIYSFVKMSFYFFRFFLFREVKGVKIVLHIKIGPIFFFTYIVFKYELGFQFYESVFFFLLRCSTKMECTSLSPDYWLPSVKNECLSLEFQNHPSGFAYKLDETNAVLTLFTFFIWLFDELDELFSNN